MSDRPGFGAIQTYYDLPISASVPSSGSSGITSSVVLDVGDYNQHTVQLVVTGSPSFATMTIQSSLDAANWTTDINVSGATSSMYYLPVARRKYMKFTLALNATSTGSIYQLSGQ